MSYPHYRRTAARVGRAVSYRYTLMELIIVIAIIVILLALLLPALSKARKMAKRIECAGRLKQVGAGYVMYANDNNGYVFRYCRPPVGSYDATGFHGTMGCSNAGISNGYPKAVTLINNYLGKNRRLMNCPGIPDVTRGRNYMSGDISYYDSSNLASSFPVAANKIAQVAGTWPLWFCFAAGTPAWDTVVIGHGGGYVPTGVTAGVYMDGSNAVYAGGNVIWTPWKTLKQYHRNYSGAWTYIPPGAW